MEIALVRYFISARALESLNGEKNSELAEQKLAEQKLKVHQHQNTFNLDKNTLNLFFSASRRFSQWLGTICAFQLGTMTRLLIDP